MVLQFLRNQDVLNDFTTENSIGKVLMDKLDIPVSQRQAFWYTYPNSICKKIKQQLYCIARNALKEKFLCKFQFQFMLCLFKLDYILIGCDLTFYICLFF